MGVVMDHDADSRPNFAAPIYGGRVGDARVPADAPPLFIVAAYDDRLASTGSVRLYEAWKAAGHPAELHIFARGGHGFGMRRQGLPVDHWIDLYGAWLAQQGLLKQAHEDRPPSATTRAPFPLPEPTPNDRLISPEVLSDHRVTFRIYAPKASEVTLRGDWMTGFEPVKLSKNREGIWSITVGPLVPDLYSYSFTVDGVKTLDPKNASVKQGVSSLDNMVFLPGKEAAFEENKAVPHGDVRSVWYHSSTLDTQRRMHVYTPPGYDGSKDRYPVLYLLHGGGDEDSGWSTIGRAGFILDNLLAQGKTKPMLVVMPNGSLPLPADLPPFRPGATPPHRFAHGGPPQGGARAGESAFIRVPLSSFPAGQGAR
jgi:dipeptidyl aminopeptidase/acylaminoacyl peptidase